MTFNFDWPFAHDFSRPTGKIKAQCEDFRVVERLPEQASGEGEHLWLEIEKTGQNTAWVARQIANWAGVKARDVSYAGLKDRHAVTEQTFSVHLPGVDNPAIETLDIEGCRLISAQRHIRKLKTGQLVGNQFTIRVRDVDADLNQLAQEWQQLCQHGVPNYFGPQRFGHGGKNVDVGIDWLLGKKKLPRHQQSIYLSAVRSYFFNEILAKRVSQGTWNQLIDHEFAQFTEGKAGFYVEQPADEDIERCQQGVLSPAGSLIGLSKDEYTGLDERERTIVAEFADVISALEHKKVSRHFRKLRMLPENTELTDIDGDPLFSFFLPAGSFATSVLAEIISFNVAGLGDVNE